MFSSHVGKQSLRLVQRCFRRPDQAAKKDTGERPNDSTRSVVKRRLATPPLPDFDKDRGARGARLGSIARADAYSPFCFGFKVSGDSSSNSKSEGSLEVVAGCALTVRIVSRGPWSTVAEQHLKSVQPASVLRQARTRAGDLGTCAGRIRACFARFFTKSWTVLGATEYLQMLAKEDSNLLVSAALPAQLPNYFGVLFELRAWRPFGNFVEQLANALIHRKYLSAEAA